MTLNELRFMVAVAQERNFRRAAERCFISQPALSLAIKKLEDELGVLIFERGRSEVAVTPAGMALVEQAQRVLEEAERLKTLAASQHDPLRGPLRLGVIYSVAPYLLPELMPVLQRLAPHMPLEVEENLTVHLEAELRNGKLDAAIIALPFGDANLLTGPLYDEPFQVVVPKSHRWAQRRSLRASELAEERVLLLDNGHCFSNQVQEACPELAGRGASIQQGTSLETIRNMVASGLGITVLPASANSARYRSKLLAVVPFTRPAPTRRIALAWRRSYPRTAALDVLARAIRQTRLTGIQPVVQP